MASINTASIWCQSLLMLLTVGLPYHQLELVALWVGERGFADCKALSTNDPLELDLVEWPGAQVLALLSEAPGCTLRMSALATQAEGSLPRLSQVVGRMEQRGWVRRTPDPTDGRNTLAILTDQGRAKVTEAAPATSRRCAAWCSTR